MFLARLRLNRSRVAVLWSANAYRVHQRLQMAFPADPRLLFRIEDMPNEGGTQILVQSHTAPDWTAFDNLAVLHGLPEYKPFDLRLEAGRSYRFRLLANPTVKRDGKRLSLFREEEQREWLERKLADAGAEVLACRASPRGLQRSRKNPQKDEDTQTHFAVLFEGTLRVTDPATLKEHLANGLGSAKGYGFGLLSLAPA